MISGSVAAPAIPAWQRALFERRTIGVHLSLEVVRAAYDRLDRPGSAIPAVHVVGTNGKGSTAAMVAHGLRRAGRRVGLTVSPHLHRIHKRIVIDGAPIDDDTLRGDIDRILALEAEGGLPGPISFFEILTLAGFLAFARAGVDVIVLECGLGGRLDATRIGGIVLTLVTPIALDHQRFLGPDLAAIAGEKAAVFENRASALAAPQGPIPAAVLRETAARYGTSLRFTKPAPRPPHGLPGAHQRINAGLALAALEHLLGEPVGLEAVDEVRWPGRLEGIAYGGGRLLLDVAHNPHGIAALAAHLQVTPAPPGGRLIVFGCMRGKQAEAMLGLLTAVGAPLLLVPPAERDGWAPEDLAAVAPPSLAWTCAPSVFAPEADGAIRACLARGGEVVVCGSCYLVGAFRAHIFGEALDPILLADPLPRGPEVG